MAIPYVIGIALGKNKAESILGALNGNYLNVLVTDELTAESVLETGKNLRTNTR